MVETEKPEESCTKQIYHGVYLNYNFVSAMTSFLGNIVKLLTIEGRIYEGIFLCFSPDFEVVLELVHEVSPISPTEISFDNLIDKFVFSSEFILTIEIVDAEIDCPTREIFSKDNEISKLSTVSCLDNPGKELEPWDCPEENNNNYELDISGQGGWDPKEMFKKNEQLYGVTSDFNEELSLYTSPLNINERCEEPHESASKPLINDSRALPMIEESSVHVKISPVLNTTKKDSAKGSKKSKSRKSQNLENSSIQKDQQTFKSQKKGQLNNRPEGNQKISHCSNSSISNSKRNGSTNETKASNDCGRTNIPGNSKVFHSNLNPLAKEFVPVQMRPPVISSFQVPYSLPCPAPMSAVPRPGHLSPQAPVYAAPFQPPIPYPAATFYAWKPIIYNQNYTQRQ